MAIFGNTIKLNNYYGSVRQEREDILARGLDLAYTTETGREAIKWGADLKVKVKYPISRSKSKNGNIEGAAYLKIFNTVYLERRTDSEAKAASRIVHELNHAKQKYNRRKNAKKFHGWDRKSVNYWYNDLIGEGDSHTQEIITAFELSLKGQGDYWKALSTRSSTKDAAAVLVERVKAGDTVRSDSAQQAVFDAWMKGDGAKNYSLQFMRELVRERTSVLSLLLPGARSLKLTLKSEDLSYNGLNQNGHSYLSGMNLLCDNYCEVWKSFKSTRGLFKTIRRLEDEQLTSIRRFIHKTDAPSSLSLVC